MYFSDIYFWLSIDFLWIKIMLSKQALS